MADEWELPSIGFPLMAIALASPLTLHFLVGALIGEAADYDGWIVISMAVVGHCHLILAGLAWRFARQIRRTEKPVCARGNDPNGMSRLRSAQGHGRGAADIDILPDDRTSPYENPHHVVDSLGKEYEGTTMSHLMKDVKATAVVDLKASPVIGIAHLEPDVRALEESQVAPERSVVGGSRDDRAYVGIRRRGHVGEVDDRPWWAARGRPGPS